MFGNLKKKGIALGIFGAAVLALSGCEKIDGVLNVDGELVIKDRDGVEHTIPKGAVELTVKNRAIIFRGADAEGNAVKEKIKINPGSIELPRPGSEATFSAARTGQNVDVFAKVTLVDVDRDSDRRTIGCDCVIDRFGRSFCFGRQEVFSSSILKTIRYELLISKPGTQDDLATFSATETEGSSNSSFGFCDSPRIFIPRPRPPVIIGGGIPFPGRPGPVIINPPRPRPNFPGPVRVDPPRVSAPRPPSISAPRPPSINIGSGGFGSSLGSGSSSSSSGSSSSSSGRGNASSGGGSSRPAPRPR